MISTIQIYISKRNKINKIGKHLIKEEKRKVKKNYNYSTLNIYLVVTRVFYFKKYKTKKRNTPLPRYSMKY